MKWTHWFDVIPFGNMQMSVYGPWDPSTHIHYHKACIIRYREQGKTLYEAAVNAGPYGETRYLFEERIPSAKTARILVEQAVTKALQAGDLTID